MSETPRWEPIEGLEGLWSLEKRTQQGWSLRAHAVRLLSGGLCLIGPLKKLPEACHEQLLGLGKPELILAPNYYHHLGLPEHKERYPEAKIVSSQRARPRLIEQSKQEIEPLDRLLEALPPGVDLLEPPGVKTGELWLRVVGQDSHGHSSVGWVVTDAFFHVETTVTGLMGVALKVTRTVGGLRIGRTFNWLALEDKARYRAWLEERIDADSPALLIPGHGTVLEDERLPERMMEEVRARLG